MLFAFSLRTFVQTNILLWDLRADRFTKNYNGLRLISITLVIKCSFDRRFVGSIAFCLYDKQQLDVYEHEGEPLHLDGAQVVVLILVIYYILQYYILQQIYIVSLGVLRYVGPTSTSRLFTLHVWKWRGPCCIHDQYANRVRRLLKPRRPLADICSQCAP